MIAVSVSKTTSARSNMRTFGAGSGSRHFDDFFQVDSGGVNIVVESDIAYSQVMIVASANGTVTADSGESVELANGTGVIVLNQPATAVQLDFDLPLNSEIYITRFCETELLDYAPQSGFLISEYTTNQQQYLATNAVSPAGSKYYRKALDYNLSIPNFVKTDMQRLHELLNDAALIDDDYVFGLEWSASAHSSLRQLCDIQIKGMVYRA